jgi:hypothetical protein
MLRELTVTKNFAPKGRASSINHYAVGFVREVAAQILEAEKVDRILEGYGGRAKWKSANDILKFTPELVKEVIDSGKLSELDFARRIADESAFLAFANKEAAEPGSRKKGTISS